MSTSLSFSIVIEWDNARLADADRARQMLAELSRQIASLPAPRRRLDGTIVAYDPSRIDQDSICRIVASHSGKLPGPVRFVAHREASGYYELKNLGARQAGGDIIVFIDSDVVPAAGWLGSLLAAFDDSRVEVACGGTFVTPQGLYGKAFALFWFFPLRSSAEGLRRTHHFFANNVAFRRSIAGAYPFPDLAQSRGQCVALASRLVADGVGLFRQQAAWVSHPPPHGFRHFCTRAITQGHDRLADVRRDQEGRAPALKSTYWAYVTNLRSAMARISRHYRDVGLRRSGAGLACLLAILYYTLMAAGEMLTRANPGFVRRHLLV